MKVDGRPNVRTCITKVRDGMIVESIKGLGKWEAFHE
ncbi:MAG: (2Fe-2S)-binding protein [Spirochaetota bacterium]|nr:MAG: (2Fe-2S)-binding protein [Spirochaetota bacterium]